MKLKKKVKMKIWKAFETSLPSMEQSMLSGRRKPNSHVAPPITTCLNKRAGRSSQEDRRAHDLFRSIYEAQTMSVGR